MMAKGTSSAFLPPITDAQRYAWLRENNASVHVQENIEAETHITGARTFSVFDPYVGYLGDDCATMDEAVDKAIRNRIRLMRNLPGAG